MTNKYNKWTKEELDILRDNKDLSMDELVKLIPNHTRESIYHKRTTLGITKKYNYWTTEEIRLLKEHMTATRKELIKLLPNHSYDAIMMRASKLGLKKEVL